MTAPIHAFCRATSYRLNDCNYCQCCSWLHLDSATLATPLVPSLLLVPAVPQDSCALGLHAARLMRQLLLHCLCVSTMRHESPWLASVSYRLPCLPTISAISASVGMLNRRAINSRCIQKLAASNPFPDCWRAPDKLARWLAVCLATPPASRDVQDNVPDPPETKIATSQ